MNHLNHWEEEMRRRLSEHQAAPSAKGWERLQEALNAAEVEGAASPSAECGDSTAAEPKKGAVAAGPTKRKPFWLRHPAVIVTTLSAAACLLAVFVLRLGDGYEENSIAAQTDSVQNLNNTAIHSTSPVAPTVAGQTEFSGTEKAKTIAATKAPKTEPFSDVPSTSLGASAEKTMPEAVTTEQERISTCEVERNEKQIAEHVDPKGMAEKKQPRQSASRTWTAQARSVQRATSHRPHFSLSVNPAAARNFSNSGNYYQVPLLSTSSPESSADNILNDMEQIVVATPSEKVESHVSHNATIRYGLGVSIPLTGRWMLHTGLTYSRLSTDIQAGSADAYYRTEQRLHYVGIPVQLSYTFFTSRYVNLYAAGGGTIEKCVKGTLSTTVNNSESMRSNESGGKNLADGLWQASVGAAMGVQLNLTKNIGIYAEPGVSYYIPDGSSLPNIRHDYPWRFDLQAGLRFNFE